MAESVDRHVVEIDFRTARNMQEELRRANESLKGFEEGVGSLKSMVKEFAAGFAGAFTFKAFVESIHSALESMDQMGKRSQQLGLTTESLSALTYQAKLAGLQAQELDTAIVKLNSGLADLGYASNASTKALEELGITAGTETQEALEEIADQFAAMPDGVRKTALAVDLFGRSGAKLIPLLNQGSKGMAEFAREAESMGLIVTKETQAAVEQLNDNMTRLQESSRGRILQLTQGLVPALTQVTNAFTHAGDSAQTFRDLGEGIGEVVKFGASLFIKFAATVQAAGRFIGGFVAGIVALGKTNFSEVLTIARETKADIDKIEADAIARLKALEKPAPKPELPDDEERQMIRDITNFLLEEAMAAGIDVEAWIKLIDTRIEAEKALAHILDAGYYDALIAKVKRLDEITGRGFARKQAEDMALLDEALVATDERLKITVDEWYEGALKIARANDRLQDKNKETTDSFIEMGKAIQQSVEGWSGAAADAVLDFATGAERDITKMVEGIIRQFAKLALQKMIFDPLFSAASAGIGSFFRAGAGGAGMAALGEARGAAFGGGGRLAFAGGGVVSGPTQFAFAGGTGLMGEAGPEAIMPLKRNAAGELGVEGGGVSVTVINQAGAQVDVETEKSSDGRREITIMIQRAVTDGFARGRFDSIMSATYGLSRQGH